MKNIKMKNIKTTLLLSSMLAIGALTACESISSLPILGKSETTASKTVSVEAIVAESKRLNEWFDAKYEAELQYSPIQLTFLGRKDKYDELDDMSEAASDASFERNQAYTKEMIETFDYDKLDAEAKMSYDIWVYQSELSKRGREFRHNNYIFEQMGGPQSFIATFMISFHKVEEESDMVAYNKRLSLIKTGIDSLVDQAKSNAEGGVRPPKFAYEGVIEQSAKIIEGAPFSKGDDSSLWADAKAKVAGLVEAEKITKARGDELLAESKAQLLASVGPAYTGLIDWVKADLANVDKVGQGVGALPNGEAYYNYQLASSTTTDLTSDEVHEIGLAEVARIQKEMLTIIDAVGHEGDLQSFFALLRDNKDDKRFYYPDTDEGRQAYIDDATAAIDNIETNISEYFGILPKAGLDVKRVESFREQDGAAQHYYPGTPDGSRNGIYYAHLSDMTAMPKNQLEVIAYHEGIPGHHMQISIAQELESVPQFRTQAGFGAYIEGWALYSEKLAKEIPATYEDPYSDFGRLTTEMWRGIRLVVDTGLHAKGWTEQEAIDYFKANSPEPEESIRSEVRRYMVWPGQATSYKIGMIKIQELRAMAEKELGDDFDIKAFHDTVLGGGALPLSILERRVEEWVASVKSS